MMARKRDKERDRVRKIGIEYQSLSEMLGLHPRKQNKVLTLKAALQFIVENYEGMTTLVPGLCTSPSSPSPFSEMMKMEEAANSIEVTSSNVDSQQDFLPTAVVDSPQRRYQDSSNSKEEENLLLCYEEVNYQDDSEEESNPEETLSGSMSGSSHAQCSGTMVVSDISSSPAQFCIPPTPSNTVLFSPNNAPWLTTASPQIGNAFSNFSPPMQVLQAQTTPKLHHLSPPIPSPVITGVYSPCIQLSGSPQFLPMFDTGQRDFHFLSGECACNIQQ